MQEVQEMPVWSLGQEDFLKEDMATHPNNLAWRIPMDRGANGLQSMGSQRVRATEWLSLDTQAQKHNAI